MVGSQEWVKFPPCLPVVFFAPALPLLLLSLSASRAPLLLLGLGRWECPGPLTCHIWSSLIPSHLPDLLEGPPLTAVHLGMVNILPLYFALCNQETFS